MHIKLGSFWERRKEVGYLKRLSEGIDLRQRRSEDEG